MWNILIHLMAKGEEQGPQTPALPVRVEVTAVVFSCLGAGISTSHSVLGFKDHFGIILLGLYAVQKAELVSGLLSSLTFEENTCCLSV